MSGNPTQRAKSEAIGFALHMAKRPKFASGGVVGPLMSAVGGRTDKLPISVPAGSYVIPADAVSGVPGAEGNSLAGHRILAQMLDSAPFGISSGPYKGPMPSIKQGPGMRAKELGLGAAHMATGGPADESPEHVDILAAGGEYVVPAEQVKAIGRGNIKLGHEILDEFVKHIRKKNIEDLKKLKPPVKK